MLKAAIASPILQNEATFCANIKLLAPRMFSSAGLCFVTVYYVYRASERGVHEARPERG